MMFKHHGEVTGETHVFAKDFSTALEAIEGELTGNMSGTAYGGDTLPSYYEDEGFDRKFKVTVTVVEVR